ncbi:MAG: hypothetical protein ACE5F1_02865 [Planctomycetota bacterium]
MRFAIALVSVLFASCASYGLDPSPRRLRGGEDWGGSASIGINRSSFESGDLMGFRVEGSYGSREWEVQPELGIAYNKDTATNIDIDLADRARSELSFLDISVGAGTSFAPKGSNLVLRAGGGVIVRAVDFELSGSGQTRSDDDIALGVYVHGGPAIRVAESVEVGLDLRAIFADKVGTVVDFKPVGGNRVVSRADGSSFETALTVRILF